MSRGPRKTIEDKIREKEELIQGLKTRIQAETKELETLKQEKRAKEIAEIAGLLEESGVTIEQARDILEQHIAQESRDEGNCA